MEAMNLLLIVSDQHNPFVLGAAGNSVVRTPNLDAMAREGVYYRAAYCASPLCVPARAALATGQYVHRIGAWDNASPYLGKPESWGHRALLGGVAVTTVGKLHYRRVEDDTGFPHQVIPMHVKDGVGAVASLVRDRRARSLRIRAVLDEAGPGESEYTAYDRAVALGARTWLRETGSKCQSPWILVVGFVAPHFPLIAPQQFYDLYSDEEIDSPVVGAQNLHPAVEELRSIKGLDADIPGATVRRAKRAYFGLTSFLDEQIGQLLDTVEDLHLGERTRVIYTSDHGEMLGEHGLWGKSAMYEGSVGVPLILKGPDQEAGATREYPVSHLDLFPTILEAVGVPDDGNKGRPGLSLWTGFDQKGGRTSKVSAWEERSVMSEYHGGGAPVGMFMLRQGRWKLIYYVGAGVELFDLHENRLESCDLSATTEGSKVVRRLEMALREIVDPEAVDLRARRDQAVLIESHGGVEAILSRKRFFHTPVPPSGPTVTI